MNKGRARRYTGPIILLAVAGLLGVGAALSTHGFEPADAPLDLKTGATSVVEFRVRHSGSYSVGVEMKQEQAKRLFPCMVDFLSPAFGRCGPKDFPLELRLHMQAIDGAAPLSLQAGGSTAGGSFQGEAFTRPIAYTSLEAGKTYRLTATSQVDGTSLTPTSPRLVVVMEAGSRKGKEMMAMLVTLLAWTVGVVAIVWAGTVFALRLRAAAEQTT